LGLGDEKDITVKGLEVVQKCERVYLEHYTSILTVGKEALETFYGRDVLLADRDLVEQGSDEILQSAKDTDVALLVVGPLWRHHAFRSSPSRGRRRYSFPSHSQRLHYERDRLLRTPTVQLWRNRQRRILDRFLETRKLLR